MNLTCGRNPWKRASVEDSTFRAYLRNPKFLSSILPLSPELDAILRRIFECDPRRRISIVELRDLVIRCPRFTTRTTTSPPTPPPDRNGPEDPILGTAPNVAGLFQHYSSVPYTPSPSPPLHPVSAQHSHTTVSSDGSIRSDDGSSYSIGSTDSVASFSGNCEDHGQHHKPIYVPAQPANNYYGSFLPLDPVSKQMGAPSFVQAVQVC